MKTRIITGAVLVCVLIPLLIFSDTIVFPIAMSLLTVVALLEMANCMSLTKFFYLSAPVFAVGATSVMSAWFVSDRNFVIYAALGCLILMLYTFALTVFSRGKRDFSELSGFLIMSVYIIAAFASILLIRRSAAGHLTYLLIFIGPWVCDTFAYFTGRFLGRHKLIPEVSPKKTVEGSIGGIVFCIGGYLIYGLIVEQVIGGYQSNYILLAIAGLAVSIISQIGDLIASVIKRRYGVKDYGRIFPGHGGVMDRFDSVLPTSIAIYIICALSGLTFFAAA